MRLTAGARLPSTFCAVDVATALCMSTASVVVATTSLMAPPLRRMALASMLIPSASASASAACTAYVKTTRLKMVES